ncbi:MAG: hypothetical protein IJ175_07085 [Clostridia bacterium]|nr:hypothetical protein [Clostridia bacterium]
MSLASEIRAAVAFTGLPCEQISYDGAEDTYFTFNMFSTPDDFGDDEPGAEVWSIQLHLFAPFTTDTTLLRRQIKTALRAAGFTAPSMVDASESVRVADGTEQHLVFEFEASTGVGDQDV